jgi:hypothetical protein
MLKFSAKTKFEEVTLESDAGEVVYTIHQLTGAQADDYRAAQAAKLKLDGAGNVIEITDFKGQFTELLKRCVKGPDGKLVEFSTLGGWPDETLQGLHAIAMTINKMNQDKDEEVDPKKS